jgi:hypothetical protein
MTTERLKPYFEFSSSNKHRVNGLCKLCKQNYKDRNGIHSNFWKHLKRTHSSVYEPFSKASDDNLRGDLTIEIAIVKCLIVQCNLPLSLVENVAFREFMKECNVKWSPISTKKRKQDLITTFEAVVNSSIRHTLDPVAHVTLTVDVWSDRRCRSFLFFSLFLHRICCAMSTVHKFEI